MAASPFLMQYMQDGDPVGAIFAGAQNRPAEELVTALRKGNHLCKYGRRGKPKTHYFRLSRDDRELVWDSSNGKTRSIPLASVVRVQQGQTTEVFLRDPLPEVEALSFSLIYTESKSDKKRSLDVICKNVPEFQTWYWGIQLVIAWAQHLELQQDMALLAAQEAAFAAQKDHVLTANGNTAAPHVDLEKLQEFKQIAAALQPTPAHSVTAKPAVNLQQAPAVKAVAALGAGPTRQRLSGLLGLPDKREIGDCYIWGDWGGPESFASFPTAESGALQSCCLPVMVTNTHALDVIQVAVGARHAALLTRGGEVYTWGSGQGGKLGNGSTTGSFYPYQVTRLSGKGTVSVACGRTYTAAVLEDGSLYTWGTGVGGQLGLGPTVSTAVWPMRVSAALNGIRVDQISCGPFHAAAISDDGCLFTWGDGMFGKLGHGSHESSSSPKAVSALADYWVLSVSCGWWHSAAAAAPRTTRAGHSNQPSADMSEGSVAASSSDPGAGRESGIRLSGRGNGVQAKGSYKQMRSSSMGAGRIAAAPSETGGWLFTWGGDFTWQQRGKRDHHEGCLGLGDLNGRLTPTVVKGEDDIKQVACGLNFTVALTGNGEVLQMGSTGAENSREHDAMWEGARVPVLVSGQMTTHFAEGVACGMSHVAVIATQRGKNSSAAANGGQVTRLLTWGQGSRGQLGLGEGRDDHLLPQVVTAVAGRRILYLACGGNYTFAVCEHDPRTARCSRDSQDIDMLPSPAPSSNNLISLSTVSKIALSAAATASSVGAGGAAGFGSSGSDRAVAARLGPTGSGGLVLSASVNSLASSVPSSSRGDGGSGGGNDVNRTMSGVRKSDRGKLESRYSERGLVHQSLNLSQSLVSAGSRDRNSTLSRSLDRNLGSLVGVAAAAVGNGDGSKGIGFGTNPATAFAGDRRSDKSGSSSFKESSRDRGVSDANLMPLQALSGSGKKSRLAFTKSLKNMVTNSSNNSSSNSSKHGWGGLNQQQMSRGAFRQGSNMTNSSVRSETDLMTVSTNSSLSSMTPTPSNNSIMDGRQVASAAAAAAGGDMGSAVTTPSSDAAAMEVARQLRYWQERAANMEQQLTRKTHELEQLRKEMDSPEQPTAQQQQQQQQLRRSSAGGGARESAAGGSTDSSIQPGTVKQQVSTAHPVEAAAAATVSETPQAADDKNDGQGAGAGKQQADPAAAAAVYDGPVVPDQLHRDGSLAAWAKVGRSSSHSGTTSISNNGAQPVTAAAAAGGGGSETQLGPSLDGQRGSSEQFRFENLNPAAPTGLDTLREMMGCSSSNHPAAAAVAVGDVDNSSRGHRRSSSVAVSGRPGDVILQDSAFQEMGTHSNEASRVLALFQESHRHRQELEEQQQQQGNVQVSAAAVAAVGAAHPLDVDDADEVASNSGSIGYVSAFSSVPPVAAASAASANGSTSINGHQQQQQGSSMQHTSSNAGERSAAGTGTTAQAGMQHAGAASAAESIVAAELQKLRDQNQLLQQQLHEAVATSKGQHQQQQQQQFLPPVVAVQQLASLPPLLRCASGAVSVISLTPGSSATGPLGGHRHRRTVSVDISSSAAGHLTHEVAPGIFLSLQALESGVGYELKRVRFAKQVYSAADADAWWATNKAAIYAAYYIVDPSLDEQQQRRQSAAVSSAHSSSRGNASSFLNLQQLGAPNAVSVRGPRGSAAAAAGGSAVHGKRVSAGSSDALPGSPLHSPTLSITGNCSTYELDLFKPSSAAQPAAAAGGGGGGGGGGASSSSSIPGDGLSRLGRTESAAAAACGGSSSGRNSPASQVHKRAATINRAGSIGAAGLAAAEQLVSGMQGQNGNIVSMVRSQSLQQQSVQGNAAAGSQQQQQQEGLTVQEGMAVLSPGYVEEWQLARFNRYSQRSSSDSGSLMYSGMNSSSGGGEQKRGGSAAGGIFRLFSRSGDSAGA